MPPQNSYPSLGTQFFESSHTVVGYIGPQKWRCLDWFQNRCSFTRVYFKILCTRIKDNIFLILALETLREEFRTDTESLARSEAMSILSYDD